MSIYVSMYILMHVGCIHQKELEYSDGPLSVIHSQLFSKCATHGIINCAQHTNYNMNGTHPHSPLAELVYAEKAFKEK